ncbi:MAG: hypothetical protein U5K00_08090 [Melioribacteraceae bacterium]|nr:hypothetical protein [Melioribacteraceae bacterium]
MTPDIYKDWEMSRHGDVNFGCYLCHGDGQETFYPKGTDELRRMPCWSIGRI